MQSGFDLHPLSPPDTHCVLRRIWIRNQVVFSAAPLNTRSFGRLRVAEIQGFRRCPWWESLDDTQPWRPNRRLDSHNLEASGMWNHPGLLWIHLNPEVSLNRMITNRSGEWKTRVCHQVVCGCTCNKDLSGAYHLYIGTVYELVRGVSRKWLSINQRFPHSTWQLLTLGFGPPIWRTPFPIKHQGFPDTFSA
jgi:hypothetical protein